MSLWERNAPFILPDKKLEKDKMGVFLKKHTLDVIIKLPENLFDAGVTTQYFCI